MVSVPVQPMSSSRLAAAVQARVERAKRSFTCRRVQVSEMQGLEARAKPAAGDVVLAKVTELGHHTRLESPEGRRAQLYVGDEILVAFGARYAPDQFWAEIPDDLGPCDLVAGGGIAARVKARHARTRRPTAIQPVGVLTDATGAPVNLRNFALPPPASRSAARHVMAVVGTSMNAGKTTAAASLIRGLRDSGLRVGACKVTGTGSGGDVWSMADAGADHVLDFTDVGFATTAGAPIELVEDGANTLVSRLEAIGVDVVVVEVADGLLQRETSALLNRTSFASRLDSIVLAAADSMGALAGADWLRARDLPLRAVTGLLTASPLAAREAQDGLAVDVIDTKCLSDPTRAARLALGGRSQLCIVS